MSHHDMPPYSRSLKMFEQMQVQSRCVRNKDQVIVLVHSR